MSKYLNKLILSLCLFCAIVSVAAEKSTIDSLMKQLDDVIANREVYLAEKEARIAKLRHEVDTAADIRKKYDLLIRLYNEYSTFNTDSAYRMSLMQEEIGRNIGDSVLVTDARMNRANILCATGMYNETLALMDTMRLSKLPEYLHPYYYHIKRTVYGRLADYAAFAPDKERYDSLTRMYRDSIILANPPGSLANMITRADRLNVSGSPAAAITVLNDFMANTDLSEHDKAICGWTLSESYGKLGDRKSQKEWLLRSSISDLKSSVREYVSLRQLALLLYEEGDLNRAYDFLTIAVEDATECNARQRIVELNDYYPKINELYVETVQKQKSKLKKTIIIITVLSLLLLVLIIYMRKQMLRINKAKEEIAEAFRQLNELTAQLKASNEKLSDANSAIAEISELKEIYIGNYMDQCIGYIEKLDGFRKQVAKLVNSGKYDELKGLTKSSSFIDDEFKLFYDRFDKTFLSLYPTFVEDFNSLLMPDEAIMPKKAGSLNTELRIFALIRLGISDSDKIAKFLRYSLTTIYNYRTKVRNKARGDRNELENEILKIGRSTNA